MFAATRRSLLSTSKASSRSFSSTSTRAADVAKLILIGRLGRDAEVRTTRTDKEFVSYTVATANYPSPPPNPDGTRPNGGTTWHTILSFNPSANNFLRTLQKGTQVYVEANYQLREPDPDADPDTPAGQRQIFLRHETLRVLKSARPFEPRTDSSEESS